MKNQLLIKFRAILTLVACALVWTLPSKVTGEASGWGSLVTHDFGGGWQHVTEMHVYDTGSGWRWISEAGMWGYFVELEELSAGAVALEHLRIGDRLRFGGYITEDGFSTNAVLEFEILSETTALVRYEEPDEGFVSGPVSITIDYTVTEESKAILAYGKGDPDFSGELELDFGFRSTGSFTGLARDEAVEYGFEGWFTINIKLLDPVEAQWKVLSPNYAYTSGGGWHWLPEAEIWVFVYDPETTQEPQPADMVLVQGGTLTTSNFSLNGTLVETFYIGRYEVTWGEWQEVRTWAAANGYDIVSRGEGCADDHPVHTVNWYDVVKWCNAKSEMEGLAPVYTVSGSVYRTGEFGSTGSHVVEQNLSANGYRLPLEAEWEFAAGGGNQTNEYMYSGSHDINTVGWYWDNSSGAACNLSNGLGTWPVGQKAHNELGLYDMSGNVWEWCWDNFGTYRRVRGGSWSNSASYCSVSYRYRTYPTDRWLNSGFRLARTPSP